MTALVPALLFLVPFFVHCGGCVQVVTQDRGRQNFRGSSELQLCLWPGNGHVQGHPCPSVAEHSCKGFFEVGAGEGLGKSYYSRQRERGGLLPSEAQHTKVLFHPDTWTSKIRSFECRLHGPHGTVQCEAQSNQRLEARHFSKAEIPIS